MKILLRTLIILLAAAVVTAGTLGALQVPAVQSWISSSQGSERHGPPAGMAEGQFAGSPASAEDAGATDTTAATAANADQSASIVAAASTDSTATTSASTSTPPMRGEGGGRSGGNLQGLVEVGKNLGIVVAVSLAIAAVGWMGKRLRPHRPAPAAAA